MNSTQSGLTVGELTIAISVLILGGLIWTTVNKKDSSQDLSNRPTSNLISKTQSIQLKL